MDPPSASRGSNSTTATGKRADTQPVAVGGTTADLSRCASGKRRSARHGHRSPLASRCGAAAPAATDCARTATGTVAGSSSPYAGIGRGADTSARREPVPDRMDDILRRLFCSCCDLRPSAPVRRGADVGPRDTPATAAKRGFTAARPHAHFALRGPRYDRPHAHRRAARLRQVPSRSPSGDDPAGGLERSVLEAQGAGAAPPGALRGGRDLGRVLHPPRAGARAAALA